MPTGAPRYIEFDPPGIEEVVAAMEAISRTNRGWINFEPAVHVDDVPEESGLFSLFSARGSSVPFATWTPPSAPRRGRSEPAMIGLQHPAGARARPILERMGHPVPDGWRVTQDYVKKGMVVVVPPDAPHGDVVRWLVSAASLVSMVPLAGRWRAAVYEG